MMLSIVFFLLYVIIVTLIGVLSSRNSSEDDFMIAERKVEGVQVAATMSAGYFDGATLGIFIAYVYQYGFSAIWLFVGLSVGFIVARKYAHRIKQKADGLGVYSMPEYFFRLLGKRNGLMFSFFLVLQYFALLIVNLVISSKILSVVFGIPYWVSIVIGAAVVLGYLLLAGFKAVVRTDFFQLMVMVVLAMSVGIYLFGHSNIPAAEWNLGSMGAGNIIGFVILSGFGIIVQPDLWQRIFATKDEKNLRRGLNYSILIFPILGVVISVLGLATKQAFPDILPENALVTGFSSLLPYGLKEFGLVLLYAVSLSSSDTVAFVVSSIFTRDLKNYSQRFSQGSMKKLTRIFISVFIFLAALIAVFYQNIIALGFSLASLNLALFPVVFGSLYWDLDRTAVFWSLVLGLLSVGTLFILGSLTPENSVISLPVVLLSLSLSFTRCLKENRCRHCPFDISVKSEKSR